MAASQQINLYQEEFRREAVQVSAAQVGKVLLVLLLLLGVLVSYGFIRKYQLQAELAELKQQQTEVATRLATVQAQVAARQPSKALQQQVDELTGELVLKQQVMQVLSGRQLGNTQGFVEHFTGLARQRHDGLWLTGLAIQAGGSHISMQGTTLKPEYVPQYLQRLAQEPVFAGTVFKTLLMERNKEKSNWLDFNLKSEPGKETPK